jgi:hypothetical protein
MLAFAKFLASLVFLGCVFAAFSLGGLAGIDGRGTRFSLALAVVGWTSISPLAIGCAYFVLGKGSGVFCLIWLGVSIASGIAVQTYMS